MTSTADLPAPPSVRRAGPRAAFGVPAVLAGALVAALVSGTPAAAQSPAFGPMRVLGRHCAEGADPRALGLDWPSLCALGGQMADGAGRARAFDDDPSWARPTREALAALWPSPPTDEVGRVARTRQEMTVASGIDVVQAACEPWLDDPRAPEVMAALLDLYLYGRVLDDAVDEGHDINRQQALAVQPLLWRACSALAVLEPDRVAASEQVIRETVAANAPREPGATVPFWGAKNHHLLLGPLVLAGSVARFDELRDDLALGMWGLQAHGEFAEPLPPEDVDALRDYLAAHDHAAAICALRDAGFVTLSSIYTMAVLRAVAIVE